MRRFALLSAVLALFAGVLVGCGDDDEKSANSNEAGVVDDDNGDDDNGDDDNGTDPKPVDVSTDEKAYVEAMVASMNQAEEADDDFQFSDAQKECLAGHFVQTIGVDRFEAAGITPQDLARDDDFMDQTEMDLTKDDGYQIYDGFIDCGIDLQEQLMTSFSDDDDMPAEAKACMAEVFSGDNLREFVAASIVMGEDAIDDDPAMAQMFGAIMGCAFMGMGDLDETP